MRVLVTGCCGYIGSLLVPFLLADGHLVKGLDIGWFGDGYLPKDNGRLDRRVGDVRNAEDAAWAVRGMEAVIHLASISNDQSCQLDVALSRSVNIDAFAPLLRAARDAGVQRFIYASSSSAYGSTSEENEITEGHPLAPLTLYSESKALCERTLWEYASDEFICTAVRPATVCGYAPRQRFDLSLNMMVNVAVQRNEIQVFGGEQMRSHLHIRDMVDCYRALLAAPAKRVAGQVFNIGRANMRVIETAEMIASVIEKQKFPRPAISVKQREDNRSYHIDSSKIARAIGFVPARPIETAVTDLCMKFKAGQFADSLTNPCYMNIMQLLEQRAQ